MGRLHGSQTVLLGALVSDGGALHHSWRPKRQANSSWGRPLSQIEPGVHVASLTDRLWLYFE